MNSKLYVGNIAHSVTEGVLQDLFAQCGNVTDVHIIMDKFTGQSRGFGFVTMGTPEEAQKAVAELHDKEVEGRKIVVNEARPREERPHGGGGGGGGGYGKRPFNKGGGKPFNKRRPY
ncbi:MAG: RNA recognition motif domain-containing protein [Verrucomicrobiota bacterium]